MKTMTTDAWTDRLSEYLDGDLRERERQELEVHLRVCGACRATLAELESVVERARALPAEPPAEDLWPAIAARIARAEQRAPVSPPWWSRWRITLSVPQAAAAALALVLVSAATMWMVGRAPLPVTRGPSASGRPADMTGPGPAAPSPNETFRTRRRLAARDDAPVPVAAESDDQAPIDAEPALVDPKFDATIAELQTLLEREREHLDPSTVKVLERNLKIIDRALEDARRAVAADPSSFYLRNHLARVMRQKVDLLMTATSIAGEQG